MDEPKVIPSKFRIPLLIGLVLVLASGAVLYIQQQKKSELDAAIELVKISNLRIGVGSYGNQEGTGLFGNLHNEGDEIISIAPCRWLSWTIPEKPSSFMSFRQ